MKKDMRLAILSLLLLLSACATGSEGLTVGQNLVQITASRVYPDHGDWKLGDFQEIKGDYSIEEYIPKNESIDNWKRLFTRQNFTKRSDAGSPESLMMELRSRMTARCPSVAWNILEMSGDSVIYEWWIKGCTANDDQYEIARILDGRWNRWRVAYTVKGEMLKGEERDKWVRWLSDELSVSSQ